MNPSATTTLPVPTRRPKTFVAIALVAVLAIGVGLGIAALASGGSESAVSGSESAVSRSGPATPPARVMGTTCPSDFQNLLSAIVAMPPTVSAQVVRSLSPDLSQGFRNLAFFDPSRLPPAPDATTLGRILTHLALQDRNAIVRALPTERRSEVVAAEQSAAVAYWVSGAPRKCL